MVQDIYNITDKTQLIFERINNCPESSIFSSENIFLCLPSGSLVRKL